MSSEPVLRSLNWICRGILLEAVLAVLIFGIWSGLQWASVETDRLAEETEELFLRQKNLVEVREVEPGEQPTIITREDGVERRMIRKIVDIESFRQISDEIGVAMKRLDWLRGFVSANLLTLVFFPIFRIMGTWWITALKLKHRTEEWWRWATRLGAVVTAVSMWLALARVAGDPAARITSQSGLAQFAGALTFAGTLRFLTTIAASIGDETYLQRHNRLMTLLQVMAVACLAAVFLPPQVAPGPNAAGLGWPTWMAILSGVVIVSLYDWQLLRLRSSIREFLAE